MLNQAKRSRRGHDIKSERYYNSEAEAKSLA